MDTTTVGSTSESKAMPTDSKGQAFAKCPPSARPFDYVKYDENAQMQQAWFKEKFVELECMLTQLQSGRAKSLVLTKLEEAYMWIGKAIRDEQVQNRGAELQEERTNS